MQLALEGSFPREVGGHPLQGGREIDAQSLEKRARPLEHVGRRVNGHVVVARVDGPLFLLTLPLGVPAAAEAASGS